MKKVLMGILIGLLCFSFANAAEKGTAKEAKALLDKAVAYYKANGKDKAFAAFNDTKGKFVDRDLYIYVLNLKGDVVSHGANAKLIGQHLIELKDSDGKMFIKGIIDGANAKGTGTMDYKWTNPQSKRIEQKSTYFEKVGDIILVCGYYK
ncbi:MAG TPA: cache domain-containing protein [Syntrophales bacterium]|nr:cache domain-containing protein [Syntrophales bacterium]